MGELKTVSFWDTPGEGTADLPEGFFIEEEKVLHFLAGAGSLGVFDGSDLFEKGFLIIIAGLGLPDRIPGGFCLDLIPYRKVTPEFAMEMVRGLSVPEVFRTDRPLRFFPSRR